jgi:hypothetical protein
VDCLHHRERHEGAPRGREQERRHANSPQPSASHGAVASMTSKCSAPPGRSSLPFTSRTVSERCGPGKQPGD